MSSKISIMQVIMYFKHWSDKQLLADRFCFFLVLMLNVPVNNFSVMLGRSQLFLGITNPFFFPFFFFFFFLGGGVNMSCSRIQHGRKVKNSSETILY